MTRHPSPPPPPYDALLPPPAPGAMVTPQAAPLSSVTRAAGLTGAIVAFTSLATVVRTSATQIKETADTLQQVARILNGIGYLWVVIALCGLYLLYVVFKAQRERDAAKEEARQQRDAQWYRMFADLRDGVTELKVAQKETLNVVSTIGHRVEAMRVQEAVPSWKPVVEEEQTPPSAVPLATINDRPSARVAVPRAIHGVGEWSNRHPTTPINGSKARS